MNKWDNCRILQVIAGCCRFLRGVVLKRKRKVLLREMAVFSYAETSQQSPRDLDSQALRRLPAQPPASGLKPEVFRRHSGDERLRYAQKYQG